MRTSAIPHWATYPMKIESFPSLLSFHTVRKEAGNSI